MDLGQERQRRDHDGPGDHQGEAAGGRDAEAPRSSAPRSPTRLRPRGGLHLAAAGERSPGGRFELRGRNRPLEDISTGAVGDEVPRLLGQGRPRCGRGDRVDERQLRADHLERRAAAVTGARSNPRRPALMSRHLVATFSR
ncbi:hypothetical protein Gocc_1757 [Gaiella occulta]|uniref:Uncharacterized protein n=1 Tax=Gaiella occulta TaxID=1002870 RepID=A0A7M2YZH0_9ACTN|nr:hypothetical protein [Gaiella occulta]RDI74868.1 hypothetical protein Gocc_1757 [Gaiella occulta]